MSAGSPRAELDRPMAGRAAYALLHNTSEVVTPDPDGTRILRLPRGAIVFRDGRVLEIGPVAELTRRHPDARPLNANGRLVTPGLVDCHTHMIFAGHRAGEFARRLAGESYAAIAAGGGGIRAPGEGGRNEHPDTPEKKVAKRVRRPG